MKIFRFICVMIFLTAFLAGCSRFGVTPLINAASNGDTAQIRSLIRQGNAVNEPSKNKYYVLPIHQAAYYGHVEAVKILLEEGASVNGRDYCDQTPLVYAINGATPNRVEIANILIARGANLEAIDCFGWKPRNHAQRAEDKPMLDLLSMRRVGTAKTGLDDPEFKPEERTINFRNAIPRINYTGTRKVSIVVLDNRYYVVSGQTRPCYVGYVRPYMTSPTEDMITADSMPLGDVLTSSISLSFKNAGYDVILPQIKPERTLVLIIQEWMSDAGFNVGFTYNLTMQVRDENGGLISAININGLDDLGSTKGMLLIQSKLLVPDAAKKRLEDLLNNPEIRKALQ
jgi:ankyrin repeat protein